MPAKVQEAGVTPTKEQGGGVTPTKERDGRVTPTEEQEDGVKEQQQKQCSEEAVGEVPCSESKSKGCNKEEILAVLAHELGHWKLSHNLKNLTIGEVRMAKV